MTDPLPTDPFILDPHLVEYSQHLLVEVGFLYANPGVTRFRVFGTAIVDVGAGTSLRHLRFAFSGNRMPALDACHPLATVS